jgi:hypothetical protein
LTARSYSNAEWYSLPDPEKKEFNDLRAKKKGGDKKQNKGNRRSSLVTRESEEPAKADEEPEEMPEEAADSGNEHNPKAQAGPEFGRRAHMKEKPGKDGTK